jgi:hypothetical protein
LRYVVKREGMKKAKTVLRFMPQFKALVEPPGYPKTANEVIRQLKKALDKAERPPGLELMQKDFGLLIGAPRSTIHDWYHGNLRDSIKHFLCAMERLSEHQRAELLSKLCRDCPRLDHPRLMHDPAAVNSLRGLLAQPAGLTFVTGSDDAIRTFLVTALGNSAGQAMPNSSISGMDVHRPDSFVPVPGVVYFRNPNDSSNVAQLILELWRTIEKSPTDLILLNAVWTGVPELRDRIIGLATKHHVVVADQLDVARYLSSIVAPPTTIIKATSEPNRRIRVVVEAFGFKR